MSLQDSLARARLALSYVRREMTIGASNNFDVVWSAGRSPGCVYGSGTAINRTLRNIKASQREYVDRLSLSERNLLIFQVFAAVGERNGCGNCGIQTALALVYLYNFHDDIPLDYMQRTDRDHAFVVIGRRLGSNDRDYTTGGSEAGVCDPWDNSVYAATDISRRAYGGADQFGVESLWQRLSCE